VRQTARPLGPADSSLKGNKYLNKNGNSVLTRQNLYSLAGNKGTDNTVRMRVLIICIYPYKCTSDHYKLTPFVHCSHIRQPYIRVFSITENGLEVREMWGFHGGEDYSSSGLWCRVVLWRIQTFRRTLLLPSSGWNDGILHGAIMQKNSNWVYK